MSKVQSLRSKVAAAVLLLCAGCVFGQQFANPFKEVPKRAEWYTTIPPEDWDTPLDYCYFGRDKNRVVVTGWPPNDTYNREYNAWPGRTNYGGYFWQAGGSWSFTLPPAPPSSAHVIYTNSSPSGVEGNYSLSYCEPGWETYSNGTFQARFFCENQATNNCANCCDFNFVIVSGSTDAQVPNGIWRWDWSDYLVETSGFRPPAPGGGGGGEEYPCLSTNGGVWRIKSSSYGTYTNGTLAGHYALSLCDYQEYCDADGMIVTAPCYTTTPPPLPPVGNGLIVQAAADANSQGYRWYDGSYNAYGIFPNHWTKALQTGHYEGSILVHDSGEVFINDGPVGFQLKVTSSGEGWFRSLTFTNATLGTNPVGAYHIQSEPVTINVRRQ